MLISDTFFSKEKFIPSNSIFYFSKVQSSNVHIHFYCYLLPGHSVLDCGIQQLYEPSHLRHLLSLGGEKFKQVNIR